MAKIKLDKQERAGLALAGLALFLLAAGLIYIPQGPLEDFRQSQREVTRLQSDLLTTRSILQDENQRVLEQRWIREALEQRPPNFSLFAALEGLKNEVGLKASLSSQSPPRGAENVELVNMDIEGMSLEQLIDLLHGVYQSGNLIVVYNMGTLTTMADDMGLRCRLTFLTLKSGL
jgi:hypothetical protein